MATIASLSILLKGDSAHFEKTLTRSQKALAAFAKNAEAGGRAMMRVGAAMVAPLVLGVRQFMVEGDRLAKGAKRIGVTAEAYAGLSHAADLAGASSEAVEKAIARLSRNLYDAGRGLKTSIDGFKDLGINWEELVGLSPDEQFLKVAEALEKETDQSKKLALAQVLMGRSAADLIPLIDEGTDAIKRNMEEGKRLTGITDAQAISAEELSDRWDEAKRAFGGAAMQIGGVLAPAMTTAAKKLSSLGVGLADFVRGHPNVVTAAGAIGGGFLGMGAALYGVAFAARTTRDALIGIRAAAPYIAAVTGKLWAMAAASGGAMVALAALGAGGVVVLTWQVRKLLNEIEALNKQIEKVEGAVPSDKMSVAALRKTFALQQRNLAEMVREREDIEAQKPGIARGVWVGMRGAWGWADEAGKYVERTKALETMERKIAALEAGRDKVAQMIDAAEDRAGREPGARGQDRGMEERFGALAEEQVRLEQEELAILRQILQKEGLI